MSSDHVAINMANMPAKDHLHRNTVDTNGHRDSGSDHSNHSANQSRRHSRNEHDAGSHSGSTMSMEGHSRSMDLRRNEVRRSRPSLSRTEDFDPLLETESVPKPRPPIAHPETEDESPDDGVPNTPKDHPGVDDGFFTPGPDRPDTHHNTPKDHHNGGGGGGGGSNGGDDHHRHHNDHPNGFTPRRKPSFPMPPDYDPDVLLDSDGNPVIIPDVNVYQHKKTLAQGMMDLALLSANANQLRYVLESKNRHPYYYFSLTFISLSLILQVAVGIGLILNSQYNVKRDDHICKADKVNNFTILGIFLVTIVNVFITSFGVADN